MTRSGPDTGGLVVRDATPDDGAACAALYRPYVTDTAITFETRPPTSAEMAERIAEALRTHAWLVCEADGQVVGYAYAGQFSARDAYRWACEVSVYGQWGRRRTGIGRALYTPLLGRLTDRGFRLAVARLTLPNEASLALHEAFGFRPVGVHVGIGYKLGAWHDVALSQRILRADPGTPPEPV
ncbi:MAG: GNAT family N-acetyltransferase [Kineosporiaceae bacterium]